MARCIAAEPAPTAIDRHAFGRFRAQVPAVIPEDGTAGRRQGCQVIQHSVLLRTKR